MLFRVNCGWPLSQRLVKPQKAPCFFFMNLDGKVNTWKARLVEISVWAENELVTLWVSPFHLSVDIYLALVYLWRSVLTWSGRASLPAAGPAGPWGSGRSLALPATLLYKGRDRRCLPLHLAPDDCWSLKCAAKTLSMELSLQSLDVTHKIKPRVYLSLSLFPLTLWSYLINSS